MEGKFEKKEAAPRTIEQAVGEGKAIALETIRQRYERRDARHRLDGHNVEHTQNVMRRVREILEAVRKADPDLVSERETLIAELAASHHDIFLKDEIVSVQDGTHTMFLRIREQGASEHASADELIARMNLPENKDLFTDQDRDMARGGILLTIPTLNKDGSVAQEGITPDTPLIMRAVPFADLGDAGMDGFQALKKQGNGFFREFNYDITRAFLEKKNLSEGDVLSFKSRMLEWTRKQEAFVEGRKNSFEAEMQGLPEEAQGALRELFNKFDESLEGVREMIEERTFMPFKQLAKDMGYDVSDLS